MAEKKKGESLAVNKIILFILAVLIIALTVYAIFKFGLLDYFKNLPSFSK